MKYTFTDYPTGNHILRIGKDTLEVNNGFAEVDELDPIQVTLAEVYGGQPVPNKKIKGVKPRPTSHKTIDRTIVNILKRKRALITVIRALNLMNRRTIRLSGSPK